MVAKIKKINTSYAIPLVLIGIGLIILGLVSAKIISAKRYPPDYYVVPAVVNFSAPELTLNSLTGEQVSLSDYSNKIVLINNWATWCPPCREEMPFLIKYYKQHRDQDFILVGINAGEASGEVERFVEKYRITFPILLDPENKSLATFRNDSLPSSYVMDREGNIIFAWVGPTNNEILEKYITPLLEQ